MFQKFSKEWHCRICTFPTKWNRSATVFVAKKCYLFRHLWAERQHKNNAWDLNKITNKLNYSLIQTFKFNYSTIEFECSNTIIHQLYWTFTADGLPHCSGRFDTLLIDNALAQHGENVGHAVVPWTFIFFNCKTCRVTIWKQSLYLN